MYIEQREYQSILQKMPILCVDLLIYQDGKCLLLKRKNNPAKNEYWFPGGRIYKMETIKNAALRKAKEETNLECCFNRIVTIEETLFAKTGDMLYDIHTINICCELYPVTLDNIIIDKNHDEYIWTDKQNDDYHISVNRPLALVGIE